MSIYIYTYIKFIFLGKKKNDWKQNMLREPKVLALI